MGESCLAMNYTCGNFQVYAVGGYFILKWAWAKWNGQRTKRKSTDDPS